MILFVNGHEVDLAEGATVADAVATTGAEAARRGIAVAVGGEVVPRSEWEARRLEGGERVEVVGAIQGG